MTLRIVSLFVLCLLTSSLFAQRVRDLKPVSDTYALTNVNIKAVPGKEVEKGVVLIRKGLIVGVGKQVTIPSDAIVLELRDMYVYPGFIDCMSHIGVGKWPDDPDRMEVRDPGNPPDELAGITPQRDVQLVLNPDDKEIAAFRDIGFTTSVAVPKGGMLPGYAAVIQLSGNTGQEMVLKKRCAQYSQFVPAERGLYPATIIGVMAKMRALYMEAELVKSYEEVYNLNPAGLPRPEFSEVKTALYPVINNEIPVLFRTSNLLDIYRALSLSSELKYSLILAGVEDGSEAIPKIKQANALVFLSLNLPARKDQSEEGMAMAQTAEFEMLQHRKNEAVSKCERQASEFRKEGILFGFSSMGTKACDVKANLRRMINAGLGEDDVLAALTINPASMLGLSDQLGSIEQGKIANLVVTDKPYFDEDARVMYVFVDGQLYRIQQSEEIAEPEVVVAGTWKVKIGKIEARVVFQNENNVYTGVISGGKLPGPVALEEITVEGKKLGFVYSLELENKKLKASVTADVEGDSFTGIFALDDQTNFPIEGFRIPE